MVLLKDGLYLKKFKRLEKATSKKIDPSFDSEHLDFISNLDLTDIERFAAIQIRLDPESLNEIPCKKLSFESSNQQPRIAIRYRLGSTICKQRKSVSGKKRYRTQLTRPFWCQSSGRISGHSNLYAKIGRFFFY